jgi:hypothetical protein
VSPSAGSGGAASSAKGVIESNVFIRVKSHSFFRKWQPAYVRFSDGQLCLYDSREACNLVSRGLQLPSCCWLL